MNKLYPIGIQSFEEIRKGGYHYVDKTRLIYQLVKTGKYYFLSRPRRFGKSLLVSTLEAYFKGKKELFTGLAIDTLEQEWTEYPVLHLDLNAQKYETPDSLENILNDALNRWEKLYGTAPSETSLSLRFKGVIQRAAQLTGHNVVVLVDEYDKPLLQTINNEPLQDDFRSTLKAFYGVLKSYDKYIRFALLTGVTKFSKVSVFSDLNNLTDISMDHRYASICGITEEELFHDFEEDIRMLGEANQLTPEETRNKLKDWYDGYHFGIECPDMYNPFSLLNTFARMRFGNYWFDTGTPTFLVEVLKESRYDLNRLTNEMAMADSLGGIDTMRRDPVPILYQSGYLTVKGYDDEFQVYYLGFPNKEVEESFTKFLLPCYANLDSGNPAFELTSFVRDVRQGNIDAFMTRLKSFFADTPYEVIRDLELHYQNVMFIVFKLLGFYTQVEYHTANGRIDLVAKTDRYIYVMEFKLGGTAEEALQQIEDKQYAKPFETDPRKLYKIGVNFCNQTRNIEKWLVKE
jgi:hypothetical protein